MIYIWRRLPARNVFWLVVKMPVNSNAWLKDGTRLAEFDQSRLTIVIADRHAQPALF